MQQPSGGPRPAAGPPGLAPGRVLSVEIPSHAHPLIAFQPSDFPDSPRLPRLESAHCPSPITESGLEAFDPRLGRRRLPSGFRSRPEGPTLLWNLGAPAGGARGSSPLGPRVQATPSEAWPLPRDQRPQPACRHRWADSGTSSASSCVFHCLFTMLMDLKCEQHLNAQLLQKIQDRDFRVPWLGLHLPVWRVWLDDSWSGN